MKSSSRLLSLLALGVLLIATSVTRADEPAPLGVRALLTDGEAHIGRQIVFEGFVTGVCHSGGRKAFFHDLDPKAAGTLRVERTGGMRAFDQDLGGKTLRVTGTVRELRIDAAYLDAWEARVKATAAEHEKKEACQNDCDASLSTQAALKRIAALRTKLTATPRGYLSSLWIDGQNWEIVTAQK